MYLPRIDDLIDEQRIVYEAAPDKHLFVAGPPGSGKTSLAVWRARQLVDMGHEVVLITKSRMLVELARQLGESRFGVFTMHEFVSRDYSQRTGQSVPQFAPFEWDWPKLLLSCAECGLTLGRLHMIIDEGQNLPAGFFQWAVRYGAAVVTVFADENQTTDAGSASLRNIRDAGLPDPIRLTSNHRNTEEIARVAEYFHRTTVNMPPATVRRGRSGEKPLLENWRNWDDLAQRIATRYRNRKEAIGVIVWRKEDVDTLFAALQAILSPDNRVNFYTSKAGNEANIITHAPGITVLSGESAIGLEFDTVFLQDLDRSLPCINPQQFRRMYMLCARARNSLILVNGPTALNSAQIAALPDNSLLDR